MFDVDINLNNLNKTDNILNQNANLMVSVGIYILSVNII